MKNSVSCLLAFLSLHGVSSANIFQSNKDISSSHSTSIDSLVVSTEKQNSAQNRIDNLKNTFKTEKVGYDFVHHSKAKITHRSDLKKNGRAPLQNKHTVVFSVKQRNLEEVEDLLNDVANPRSPNYGKFLTKAEVVKMTSNPKASKVITDFLKRENIPVTKSTKGGEFITAEATVEQWETIFNTQFNEYSVVGREAHGKLIRAESYSLPSFLVHHVSTVLNTVQFPDSVTLQRASLTTRPMDKNLLVPKPAETKTRAHGEKFETMLVQSPQIIPGLVTPALLQQYYNIPSLPTNGLGSMCVFAADGQYLSTTDLVFFQDNFNIPYQDPVREFGDHVAPGPCDANDGSSCSEAGLDTQYLMAVASNVNTTFYYTDGFVLDFVTQFLLDDEMPPLVNTISYGGNEMDFGLDYINTFNNEAMKLGLIGVTLIAGSGDDGAPGSNARYNPLMCGYNPQFPASSPYVTAVGGTQGPESGVREMACSTRTDGQITSGGGFSTFFEQPWWQKEAVAGYWAQVGASGKAPVAGYAANGRGYPDVSMMAREYVTVLKEEYSITSGTSASAPVFAGMVARLNSERLAAGEPPLGWLNPALYANSGAFVFDITEGDNNCAIGKVCCRQGFSTALGWDPVTGLGSVNYKQFSHALNATYLEQPTYLSPTQAPVVYKAPTRHPSRRPTPVYVAPTVAPTQAAGYFLDSYYEDTDCVGEPLVVHGYSNNDCFDTESGSIRTSCTNDYLLTEYFNEGGCDEFSTIHVEKFFLGCVPSVPVNYYSSDERQYSRGLSCQSVADMSEYPVVSTTTNYAAQLNYNSGSGCEGEIVAFQAFKNDYCVFFPNGNGSLYINFPTATQYWGYDCDASHEQGSETVDGTCSSVSSGELGTYYYYGTPVTNKQIVLLNANGPTHAPTTFKPSAAPTRGPTGATRKPTRALTHHPTTIKPSAVPTHKPTPASGMPSVLPTPAPTIENGWFYREDYDELHAEGGVIQITGVATNECWIIYNENGKPWASARYSCAEDEALLEVYYNRGCQDSHFIFNQSYDLNVVNSFVSNYNVSSILRCTSEGSTMPIPIDTNFNIYSTYDTVDSNLTLSCDNFASTFVAYANDHCVNNLFDGTSSEYSWPNHLSYSDLGCHFEDLDGEYPLGEAEVCNYQNYDDAMQHNPQSKSAQSPVTAAAPKMKKNPVTLRDELEAAALLAIKARHAQVVRRQKARSQKEQKDVATGNAHPKKKNLRTTAAAKNSEDGVIKARRYDDDVKERNTADDYYYNDNNNIDDYWWDDKFNPFDDEFESGVSYFADDLASTAEYLDDYNKESLSLFSKWSLNYFSASPTPAPTSSPGWISASAYSESDGQGVVLATLGIATNLCQGNGTTSAKYACSEDAVELLTFWNGDCSGEANSTFVAVPLGVSNDIDQLLGIGHSVSFECSTSSDVPLPGGEEQYATKLHFDNVDNDNSTTCSEGAVTGFLSIIRDYCLNMDIEFDNKTHGVSYKFMTPNDTLDQGYSQIGYHGHHCFDFNARATQDFDINMCTENGALMADINIHVHATEEASNSLIVGQQRLVQMDLRSHFAHVLLNTQASQRRGLAWLTTNATAFNGTVDDDVVIDHDDDSLYLIPNTMDDSDDIVNGYHVWVNVPNRPSLAPTMSPTISMTPTMRPSLTPTVAPSVKPSPQAYFPTVKPTHVEKRIMSGSQVVHGVNATAFNAHWDANSQTFTNAVAGIVGVDGDSVSVTSVTDVAEVRRRLTTDTPSVLISFVVRYTIAELGVTDQNAAYEQLVTLLTDSLSTNQFNFLLQDLAVQYGATDLQAATSSDFTPEGFALNDDDNQREINVGLLVGLVVGLCGSFLIGVAIYLYILKSRANDGSAYAAPQSAPKPAAQAASSSSSSSMSAPPATRNVDVVVDRSASPQEQEIELTEV